MGKIYDMDNIKDLQEYFKSYFEARAYCLEWLQCDDHGTCRNFRHILKEENYLFEDI
jgi:hypothetical protein